MGSVVLCRFPRLPELMSPPVDQLWPCMPGPCGPRDEFLSSGEWIQPHGHPHPWMFWNVLKSGTKMVKSLPGSYSALPHSPDGEPETQSLCPGKTWAFTAGQLGERVGELWKVPVPFSLFQHQGGWVLPQSGEGGNVHFLCAQPSASHHLMLFPALGLDSAASGSSLWERPYPHTCVPRSLSEDLLLE